MEHNPLVSIITVSFNSEKTIEQTIKSVLSQTYHKIEYIIIDGASSDSTIEIAKKYIGTFNELGINYTIFSEKDRGIYDAMNKGITLSKGKLIGIINSDDWYEADTVQKVVEMYSRTNFDMMYGDIRIIGPNREYIKKAKLGRVVTTRYWNHPTMFVKREVYDCFKYKCESINDDLDFMLKVRKGNYRVEISNEVLANYRLGGISNKKSIKDCFRRIATRNKIYDNNGYSRLYYIDNFLIEFIKYILS